MTDYLKIPELARQLDVSEQTARRMVKDGRIPSVFVGGAYRVEEEDLRNYLEAARVEVGSSGKVQASLWPEEEPQRRNPEPGEAERRLSKVPEALGEYIGGRAKQHDAEIRDPASPHFEAPPPARSTSRASRTNSTHGARGQRGPCRRSC